jgi:hypothetical protein
MEHRNLSLFRQHDRSDGTKNVQTCNVQNYKQTMMFWQWQQQQQQQQQEDQEQLTILEQQKQKLQMMLNAVTSTTLNESRQRASGGAVGGVSLPPPRPPQEEQHQLHHPVRQMIECDTTPNLLQDASLRAALLRSSNGLESLRNSTPSSTSEEDHHQAASVVTASSAGESTNKKKNASAVYTLHQAGKWQDRFNELVKFKEEYDHCCVPSHWPQNSPLAQWVKRQRSQWRLKYEGKHSNMTNERERTLSELGFGWDSHTVFWEERLGELADFVRKNGHADVPTKYSENQQLSVWCKCQRRQFKLFTQGDLRTNITIERISKLANVGFDFDPRKKKPWST